MRLTPEYYLDFEHQSEDGYSRVALYDAETHELVGERTSSVYYTDTFSRRGGRRACMEKLLDPKYGMFPGDDNRLLRTYLWTAYWALQPKDKTPY